MASSTSSPGAPPKLDEGHRAFLARMVEEGPIPAVHGVVRWRGCDLIALLQEEFGISVSDDTVYRTLKALRLCPSQRQAEGLPAGCRKPQRHSKRMARPVRKQFLAI